MPHTDNFQGTHKSEIPQVCPTLPSRVKPCKVHTQLRGSGGFTIKIKTSFRFLFPPKGKNWKQGRKFRVPILRSDQNPSLTMENFLGQDLCFAHWLVTPQKLHHHPWLFTPAPTDSHPQSPLYHSSQWHGLYPEIKSKRVLTKNCKTKLHNPTNKQVQGLENIAATANCLALSKHPKSLLNYQMMLHRS